MNKHNTAGKNFFPNKYLFLQKITAWTFGNYLQKAIYFRGGIGTGIGSSQEEISVTMASATALLSQRHPPHTHPSGQVLADTPLAYEKGAQARLIIRA